MGDEWDHSLQSKEQIEANLLGKYEAAMRRERALAYAFSHQVIYFSYYFMYLSSSTIQKENEIFFYD